jgi:hypothetical protein
MSIQTTDVTCIQICLLRFLTGLGYFCNFHCSLFLFLSTCLHIMISHSIICAKLVSLLCIILCFNDVTYFVLCGINNAHLVSTIVIPSSHNILASLCCWIVDCFIPKVTIMKYDYKFTLNIVVKKFSMADTCKPWTNFWIHWKETSTLPVSSCFIFFNSMYICSSFWIFQWHLQNAYVSFKKIDM